MAENLMLELDLAFEQLKQILKTAKSRKEPTSALEILDCSVTMADDIRALQNGINEMKDIFRKLKYRPKTRRTSDIVQIAQVYHKILHDAQVFLAALKMKPYLLQRMEYAENGLRVS